MLYGRPALPSLNRGFYTKGKIVSKAATSSASKEEVNSAPDLQRINKCRGSVAPAGVALPQIPCSRPDD